MVRSLRARTEVEIVSILLEWKLSATTMPVLKRRQGISLLLKLTRVHFPHSSEGRRLEDDRFRDGRYEAALADAPRAGKGYLQIYSRHLYTRRRCIHALRDNRLRVKGRLLLP